MHKVELKSLYFNLVYVFLFSSKTQIYINKTHLHGAELKTLVQFCLTFSPIYLEEMKNYYSLTVSRTVSQLIMRDRKPKVEYKLPLQERPKGAP